MINPLSPIHGLVAVGATTAGLGIGLAIGAGLTVAAHAALAMEPKK